MGGRRKKFNPGFQSCFYGAFVCIWVWLKMIYLSSVGYTGCLFVGA